jgi:hypothetical protein
MEPLLPSTASAGPRHENDGLGVIIHVKSRHYVGLYFDIHMPRSMNGWQKKWFYLRNDVDVPLPVFIGNHPIPQLY